MGIRTQVGSEHCERNTWVGLNKLTQERELIGELRSVYFGCYRKNTADETLGLSF